MGFTARFARTNTAAAGANVEVPAGFSFGGVYPAANTTGTPQDKINAARVLQLALFRTVGFIGTHKQRQNKLLDIVEEYYTPDAVCGSMLVKRNYGADSAIDNGRLNASQAFRAPKVDRNTVTMRYSQSWILLLKGMPAAINQFKRFDEGLVVLRTTNRMDVA